MPTIPEHSFMLVVYWHFIVDAAGLSLFLPDTWLTSGFQGTINFFFATKTMQKYDAKYRKGFPDPDNAYPCLLYVILQMYTYITHVR